MLGGRPLDRQFQFILRHLVHQMNLPLHSFAKMGIGVELAQKIRPHGQHNLDGVILGLRNLANTLNKIFPLLQVGTARK